MTIRPLMIGKVAKKANVGALATESFGRYWALGMAILLGLLALGDALRPDAADAVSRLHGLGDPHQPDYWRQ